MSDRPNPLLTASAVLYFVAAVPLLFAPQELLAWAGDGETPGRVAVLQVLGSALFGYSMLNWANRHARVEGIFGRPLLIANLAHVASAALLLLRVSIEAKFAPVVAVPTALYALLAVAFGARLFRSPRPDGD
jgi:hypothetical protein